MSVKSHQEIGQQQKLVAFHEYSPGCAFFLPHGVKIYNKLVEFLRKEYRKRGFDEVSTPNIFHVDLWKKSGHWEKYRKNMFVFPVKENNEEEDDLYALKAMNCPSHCLLFKNASHSYKELPIRYADFGVLHRNELRGALHGLTRVRKFCQDDAHIFLRQDQIAEEISSCIGFMNDVYKLFNFSSIDIELSTRPEEYIGSIDTWNHAEQCLLEALIESKLKYTINKGDGAFYGPKIDIHIKDAYGRSNQCATIQLDFQLPERFELEYATSTIGVKQRPVMIHRAIFGSFERFLGILMEHTQGKWPFWLSPRQAMILPVNPSSYDYAKKVYSLLYDQGFDVEMDMSADTLDKRVKMAELEEFNYIIVVGPRDEKNLSLVLRDRNRNQETLSMDDCMRKFHLLKSSYT